MPIRVLVVDDSAVARSVLSTSLRVYDDIEVIGAAADVYAARDRIVLDNPDVVTLDIEMPRMDGVEFLRRLMPQHPIPVVVVSALATPQAKLTLQALQYGAVDFVAKPTARFGTGLSSMIDELARKIRAAASVDISTLRRPAPSPRPFCRLPAATLDRRTDKIIAIGASTGGTVAIESILGQLPPDAPGIVIAQHMPPLFTQQFAFRLDRNSAMNVQEARDGDRVLRGQVLIAPGEHQMEVHGSGGCYYVRCWAGEKVNGHRPSVDVLFASVAKHVGADAIGVMLTGMGADGAESMKAMRRAGARTVAQDEATSVVFGMPKEAYCRGGVERLFGLAELPREILRLAEEL
jgi:two-component system chemotaxis response regulator CheB